MRNKAPNTKLKNYRLFKTNFRLEKYLLGSSDNYKGRMYHTTLPNGTNILECEKGRWKQYDFNLVETEKHFLLVCPKYANLRISFLIQLLIFQRVSGILEHAKLMTFFCYYYKVQAMITR